MRFLFLSIVALCFNTIFSQHEHIFMRISPQGHMSQVRSLNVSSDGNYIVTAGFDKTAIKWNAKNGKIVEQFRGEIGIGSEGMIYKTELSPDDKYLAMAGWFGADDETEDLGDVRLFDFETGELVRVFKGLTGTPTGLGFSTDGRYIICGDENSDIFMWEVATGKKVSSFVFHSKEYDETLFKLVVEGNRMLTIDWLGQVCYWDIFNSSKPLAVDKKFIKKVLYNDIGPIAINPQLNEVIICLNQVIIVMNEKLKFVEYFEKAEGSPGFIKYNSDGSKFLTGIVGSGEKDKPCSVYSKVDGKYKEIATYRGHRNTVLAGDFIDNEKLVTAGGDDDEVHVWKLNKDNTTKRLEEFKGKGNAFYAAGKENEILGFTYVHTENFGKSKLTTEFDLLTKDFRSIEHDNFRQPIITQGDLALKVITTYTFNDGLEFMLNKRALDTVVREYWNGSRHNALTISDNGYVISGGSYGVVEAYDRKGVMVNRFVSHEGEIWSCNISNDGKNLITGGADKTIRIWPLDKLGVQNPEQPEKSVREVMEELEVPLDETVYKDIFKQLNIYSLADARTYAAWEKIITALKGGNWPCNFLENRLNFYKSTVIYPSVSMYFTDDNEWVIWNQDGYFTSSKNGAKYVGYHVNQGQDKEAKFYPFEQFDLKYNRPDIILRELDLGYENLIEYYYKIYQKRLKKHGVTESQLDQDIHAPQMELIAFEKETNSDWATLKIGASDSKYDIKKVMIYLNGVPVHGSGGLAANFLNGEQSVAVELVKGLNKFEITVENEKGTESLKTYYEIENGKIDKKPSLYIVAIGTSQYKDKAFNLKYAAKDANDVVDLFKNDPQYENVFTKVLTDQEVTKTNIQNLKGFLMGAGRNDVVMVFVAGHGLLDADLNYFYATHNVNFDSPSENGIAYEEIESMVEGLRALKKILIMDTCHSGELDQEEVEFSVAENTEDSDVMFRSVGRAVNSKAEGIMNSTEMMKELFVDLRKGTGATIIASSGGAEYSMESDEWRNGLFTYCLINGIKAKEADLDKDGHILLSELKSYIQTEVFKLSKGRQSPTSRTENLTVDFDIW